MQNEFQGLQITALIDLLTIYTEKYSHMMKAGGSTEKFKKYEELILELQTEIKTRKIQEEVQQNSDDDAGIIPVLA